MVSALATEKAATATAAMAAAVATEGAGAMVAATKAVADLAMAAAVATEKAAMAAAMAVGAEWMKTMIFLRQLAAGGALVGSWGALRALKTAPKTALRPAAARS